MLAPSSGWPCASRRASRRWFSPVAGGSGEMPTCTWTSPTSVVSVLALLQDPRANVTSRARGMVLLEVLICMSSLRSFNESQVDSHRVFQICEPLLVRSEVHGELQLVGLELADGIEHDEKISAASS